MKLIEKNIMETKLLQKNQVSESIENKVYKVFSVIAILIPAKGFEQTFDLIKTDLYDLRIKVINLRKENIKSEISKHLVSEIAKNTMFNNKLTELLNNIYEIYFEIVSVLNFDNINKLDLSFEKLNILSKVFENDKNIQYLKEYTHNSLYFEFYSIATELFINKELILSEKEQTKLFEGLKSKFELFASYAYLLGLIELKKSTSNYLWQNIEIVSRCIDKEKSLIQINNNDLESYESFAKKIKSEINA